jgi:hypothetical protein
MSSIVSIATPHLPTSPRLSGSSESRPMSVGRSNAVLSPVFALVLLVLAASSRYLNRLVRVVGRAEARELPHRPQAAAVSLGVEPAGVRELARGGDVAVDVTHRFRRAFGPV